MSLCKRSVGSCFFIISIATACGARTGLHDGVGAAGAANGAAAGGSESLGPGGGPAQPSSCTRTADCPGTGNVCQPVQCTQGSCVVGASTNCDDHDPCTRDECDPKSGSCSHSPATLDLDGDGHRAPLPGHKPGDPGSCGDDCDDTSAKAYPGAKEVCDGVDNDCNGIIDDNASYVMQGGAPLLVSNPTLDSVQAGGVTYARSDNDYLTSFSGRVSLNAPMKIPNVQGQSVYVRSLDSLATPVGNASVVNHANADADGGPVVWTGDRYGLAWSDRRDGNYEIYFNIFHPDGSKIGPDMRLSFAEGFSILPSLGWNGTDFYVFWQDSRSGSFEVYGRRVSLDAKPLSNETRIVHSTQDAESPDITVTSERIGLVYRTGNSSESTVWFQTLDATLAPLIDPVKIAIRNRFETPRLLFNTFSSNYVVLWTQEEPDFHIFGAVVAPDGNLAVSATELSLPGGQNRYPVAISLGDRFVFLYGRQGYSVTNNFAPSYYLYSQTFSHTLTPQGAPAQLTSIAGSIPVSAVMGPGQLATLFTGKLTGQGGPLREAAYVTHLQCVMGMAAAPTP